MDEQPLDPQVHGILQTHGYKRTLLTDTPWQVNGVYLYNLSDNGQDFWFQSEIWMDLLKTQARKEHRQWTLNKQTFPSALVRMGIVTPSEDRRSASLLRIAGKPQRRLHITTSLLNPSPEDDDRAVTGEAVTNQEAVTGQPEAVTSTDALQWHFFGRRWKETFDQAQRKS